MQIDVARMDPDGEHFSGDEPAAALELEDDRFVEPVTPVHYELDASLLQGELWVQGALSLEVSYRCSRCDESFVDGVSVGDFSGLFELSEESEYVDLTEEMREAIILAFPSYPVCRETCKGLCSECGLTAIRSSANVRRRRILVGTS